MRYLFLLGCFLFLGSSEITAQTKESQLQLAIDEGIIAMNNQQYDAANTKFTKVIDELKPLPSKIAFYFGKNSFFLEEYKKSINWLSKYIQLKGTKGVYYEEAKLYLELSEKKYLELNKEELSEIEDNLDNQFECYSEDKMKCPACKGSGVLITKGALGNHYATCPYSGSDGYLTCQEYNLFLKGRLKTIKERQAENQSPQ
ncbi:MAG: hypothetical protein AAFO69_19720 [Bacteroidota bacterium]